jgi:hypothetical protein
LCNCVYISTDSPKDLSGVLGERLELTKVVESDGWDPSYKILQFENVYCAGDVLGGCSCHFRHLINASYIDQDGGTGWTDFTFASPEEESWREEDEVDIENTQKLYNVILQLVSEGHKVDLVDCWNGDDYSQIETRHVQLSEVSRDAFRLFEYCRFEFSK